MYRRCPPLFISSRLHPFRTSPTYPGPLCRRHCGSGPNHVNPHMPWLEGLVYLLSLPGFGWTERQHDPHLHPRLQPSPLEVHLVTRKVIDATLIQVIPHIHRFKSFAIHVGALPGILLHSLLPAPLFERLDIKIPATIRSSTIHSSTKTFCCYASYAWEGSAQDFPGQIWQTSRSSTSALQ